MSRALPELYPAGDEPAAGSRVLIVDDDAASLYVKQRVLSRRQLDIRTAASGEAAIEAVAASPPDVVLLDVGLPGMDGIEAARRIKAAHPQVLILQSSAAYKATEDRVRALEAGADGYMAEPVDPDELIAQVDAMLRISRAEAKLRGAVETNELLFRELQHRTMNSLQLAASFVQIEARRVSDALARDRMGVAADRIRSLARVQRHLYGSGKLDQVELSQYLRLLVEEVRASLAETGAVTIGFTGTPFLLEGDRAVGVGLIANELITNAVKYAFPDHRAGSIAVTLTVNGAGARLSVIDDGVGLQPEQTQQAKGSGLNLVEMLARQARVSLEHDTPPRGTSLTLAIPPLEARA